MKRTFEDATLGAPYLGPVGQAGRLQPLQLYTYASNLRGAAVANETVMEAYQAAHELSLGKRYAAQSALVAPTIEYARFLQETRVLGPRTMIGAERVLLNFMRTREDDAQPDLLAALGDLYMNLRQRSMGIACYGQATMVRTCPAEIRERYQDLQKRAGLRYSADTWETIEGRIGRSGRSTHQPPLPPPSRLPSQS